MVALEDRTRANRGSGHGCGDEREAGSRAAAAAAADADAERPQLRPLHPPLSSSAAAAAPPPRLRRLGLRRLRRRRGRGGGAGAGVKGRREREREKERTKLRERHRRAITSRMLAGLRQYGNFLLPARADMNDVLAALAREAGWLVEPDGTTYRPQSSSSAPPPPPPPPPPPLAAPQLAPFPVRSIESPVSANSLKNCSMKASLDSQASLLRIDESLSPASLDSVVVAERDIKSEKYGNASPLNSSVCVEADQLMRVPAEHEGDFAGTSYIPVYATLPSGIINNYCRLVDPEALRQELRHLKSLNVDGVVVECWWGIVEGWSPHKYEWSGYRDLFNIIREFKLKVQVVMAFHEYGGNGSGDMPISLPKWVLEIGKDNQDIFFTDREGRRNTECLSWGIDKVRVLKGRTGIEVCFDFMRSFRTEFDNLFEDGLIAAVEIGLGASGELRYPSHPERMGWSATTNICNRICDEPQSCEDIHSGRGDLIMQAIIIQDHMKPDSSVKGVTMIATMGDFSFIDHADQVLSLANLAFEGTQIVVKIPSIDWWYKTPSHAAELTAGFYNPTNQDGYSPVFDMLKKHYVTMKFVCCIPQASAPENEEALADPEGLTWQVLNAAWDRGLAVAAHSMLPCHDREYSIRILETAKPRNDPDRRHLSFFTYHQLSPVFVQREICFPELDYFIRSMHGEATNYVQD
ncbi:Beta-amylase 8 [Ananas comosus]|uniref:Beta-amylase n=1 Tax=Ananas comosus TaxID=4615 RepID=A0A199V1R7_ANACO|nr:Beta-amylase 8 [Ananas comosus]